MTGREALCHEGAHGSTIATEVKRQKRRRRSPLVLSVLAITFASTVVAQPKVYQTGYEISRNAPPSLFWIDNDRLLFAGMNTADMDAAIAKKETNREERLKKLHLWDAKANSVTLYADAKAVCVADDIVRYAIRTDDKPGDWIIREGAFGSEKEFEKPMPSADELSVQGQMARVRSNFTCKTHLRTDLTPPAPLGRNVVVLRNGDGYLDLGPDSGKARHAFPRNLTLYQAQTGKAVKLPLTWDEHFSQFNVAYSVYRGAYVLRPEMPRGSQVGVVRPWPKGQPLIVYLLWADGQTQTVSVPHWPSEYLGHPRPMRKGWIFGGGKSPRTVALYVFDGTAVLKVESGFVREIAVSPDGCRAAVGINNRPYDMGTPISVKTFSFCGGGS